MTMHGEHFNAAHQEDTLPKATGSLSDSPYSIERIVKQYRSNSPFTEEDYGTSKKRGRPKVRDAAYYRDIWDMYCSTRDWFFRSYGRHHKSVAELLEVYYVNLFTSHGLSAMRVNSKEFKGRLRTLENEISRARKQQEFIT